MNRPSGKSGDVPRGLLTPMGDAVRDYLSRTGLGQHRKESAVYAAWDEVLGEERARLARATSFRRGELVVEVSSTPLLQELRGFTGEDFRRRANNLLDQPAIRRVTFRLRRRS